VGLVLVEMVREQERCLRGPDGTGKRRGREWDRKNIPVQNSTFDFFNLIYLATEALSDSVEFIGAVQVDLSISISFTYLYVCLYVCLSVSLSLCLSTYLPRLYLS